MREITRKKERKIFLFLYPLALFLLVVTHFPTRWPHLEIFFWLSIYRPYSTSLAILNKIVLLALKLMNPNHKNYLFHYSPIQCNDQKFIVTQYTDFRRLPEFPFLDLASAPYNYSGKIYMKGGVLLMLPDQCDVKTAALLGRRCLCF